jgi:peptide deformylase
MILNLLQESDPRLKEGATIKFDVANPPINQIDWKPIDPVKLAIDLTETMLNGNGMGLSAPQVGIPFNVFVIKSNPVIAVFNPKIVDKSTEQIYLEETSLTTPGLSVKIKRPKKIKVRYTMPNGETVTEIYDGLTSRIFQHQMDYLEGVLFTQRASLYHREKAFKDQKKLLTSLNKPKPQLILNNNAHVGGKPWQDTSQQKPISKLVL